MPPRIRKIDKEESNKNLVNMGDVEKEAKSVIDNFLGDVSKFSATKQIILGASSGWVTGFLAIRVGKIAAVALGGGIILLQVANEKGYVKINWLKINKTIDKMTDTAEDTITGKGPSWMDKAERYVDRALEEAEGKLKKGQKKAKKWYSGLMDNRCQLKEIHVFLVAFVAGVAIGIGTS